MSTYEHEQDIVGKGVELTQEEMQKIRASLETSERFTPEMIESYSYSMYKKFRNKKIQKGLLFENSHYCWPLPADTSEIVKIRDDELTEKTDECIQIYNRIIYLGYCIEFLIENNVNEAIIDEIKAERNELRARRYTILDRIDDIRRHDLHWYYGELKARTCHRR